MSEISNWDRTNPADADGLNISAGDLRNNMVAVEVMVGDPLRNLVVTNASASTIDIDADMVLIEDTSTPPLQYLARSVNLTADITASGANGLDTGSEASGTWYFCWVVYNSSTDTVASLLSTSSTLASITLPSGYTFGKFVGVAYNDGSSNFLDFLQRDDRVTYKAFQQILSNGRSDGAWSGAVDISAFIPSITKRMVGYLDLSGATADPVLLKIAADNSGNYPGIPYRLEDTTATLRPANQAGFEQELTAQSFSYWTEEGGGTISIDMFLGTYWITI